MEKIDNMTQEEFKVISEVVKESKNIPNAKLEETMDKLTSELDELFVKFSIKSKISIQNMNKNHVSSL